MLIIFFGLRLLPIKSTSQQIQSTGQVKGTVFNVSNEPLPGTTVIIEGGGATRKVRTDEHGIYEATLPSGTYQIKIEKEYFEPFTRAAFRVRTAMITTINVLLPPEGSHSSQLIYDSFSTKCLSSPTLNLSIQYRKGYRWENNNTFIYRGSDLENTTNRGIVISYNDMTIYADMACFAPKELRLIATGIDVLVENNERSKHTRQIDVDFNACPPILNLPVNMNSSSETH